MLSKAMRTLAKLTGERVMKAKQFVNIISLFFLGTFLTLFSFGNQSLVMAEESGETVSVQGETIEKKTLEHWQNLSPEEKEKLRGRYKKWQDMDPAKKEEIKSKFQNFKNLSPEQRQKIRKNWSKFQSLPPERKEAIKEKFERWKN